jgi:hypothetical protein
MSKIETLVKKALEQSYRDGYPVDSPHTAETIVAALVKAGFARKQPMSDVEATHVLR